MKSLKASWLILLCATLFAITQVQAAPDTSHVDQMISEMAESPEQHKALAIHYKAMASEARADAASHKKTQMAYKSQENKQKGGPASAAMAKHCERLVELYLSTAEENEALAKMHETAAMQ